MTDGFVYILDHVTWFHKIRLHHVWRQRTIILGDLDLIITLCTQLGVIVAAAQSIGKICHPDFMSEIK